MVGFILRRCLKKDPRKRLRDVADVGIEIEEAVIEPVAVGDIRAGETPRSRKRRGVSWTLAVFAALTVGVTAWYLKPPVPRPVTRLSLTLPPGDQFTNTGRHLVALSPDGTHLVYSANNQLYLRAMDQMEATPMSGTEGGANPFFSPDGQWVGFWADGQLRKVSVSGGAPVTLCEAASPSGASWGADDMIVFGGPGKGVHQVSSDGGTPEVLVPISAGEGYAHGPQVLPDGKSLLFTIADGFNWDNAQIAVQSLTTGERRVLIEVGRDARYTSTGHLVYALREALLAVPFDTARLEVTGGPVSLIEGVATA
jgi:serine/threonine-protein kinase